jgi:hypothetical protein
MPSSFIANTLLRVFVYTHMQKILNKVIQNLNNFSADGNRELRTDMYLALGKTMLGTSFPVSQPRELSICNAHQWPNVILAFHWEMVRDTFKPSNVYPNGTLVKNLIGVVIPIEGNP